MERLNRVWHLAHKMPKNPTLEERMEWHRGHAQHCSCRPMPASIRAFLGRDTSTADASTFGG